MQTDYSTISKIIGGFWRFGFDSTHSKCEKWFFSNARNEAYKLPGMLRMDQIATKVGDNIRDFWVSEKDIALETFTLELLNVEANEWMYVEPTSIRFSPTNDGRGYVIHVDAFQLAA